jgi:hypothetical protein
MLFEKSLMYDFIKRQNEYQMKSLSSHKTSTHVKD